MSCANECPSDAADVLLTPLDAAPRLLLTTICMRTQSAETTMQPPPLPPSMEPAPPDGTPPPLQLAAKPCNSAMYAARDSADENLRAQSWAVVSPVARAPARVRASTHLSLSASVSHNHVYDRLLVCRGFSGSTSPPPPPPLLLLKLKLVPPVVPGGSDVEATAALSVFELVFAPLLPLLLLAVLLLLPLAGSVLWPFENSDPNDTPSRCDRTLDEGPPLLELDPVPAVAAAAAAAASSPCKSSTEKG